MRDDRKPISKEDKEESVYEVWENSNPVTKADFPYEVVEIFADGSSETLALFKTEGDARTFAQNKD